MALSSTIFCDTCGAANRAQAMFCSACGRPLHNTFCHGTISSTFTGLLISQHLLNKRYRILGQIGKGGFGAVYKAADSQFGNRLLAIKEMSQSSLNSRELVEATEAFKREAFLLAGLTHPNLPRIYEQFNDTGRWYLVMDYIEGETLETYLNKVGGKLPIEKALNIGIQLCSVLDYLHTRQPAIIFRDLKPANIMLASDDHIFLIDFGIARHFKPGQAKDTTALGSSGYAAPEQYGKMQTTPRTDIYGLGATLHQALTGNDPSDTPFHFAPLQLRSHAVLADLEKLIVQMLEVDNSKRPARAIDVKQKLQSIASAFTAAQTHPLPSSLPPGYRSTGAGFQIAGATNPGALPSFGAIRPPGTIPPLSPRPKQASVPQPQKNTLYTCSGHTSRVTAVAWSPNNTLIASASYDKTVQIWDAANGDSVQICRGHAERVNAVSWSPDSKRFASASDDGTVQLWNAASKSPLFTFGEHNGKVTAVAWSPDGTRIASASEDETVHVWDMSTRRVIFTYRGHTLPVSAVAWSPDGKRIASGSLDKTVCIWEPTKDTKTNFFVTLFASNRGGYIYHGHTQKVTALAWSPDGRRVASTSSDKTMQVWDVANGRLGFIYRNYAFAMNAVVWSPDGRYLAAASNDKTLQVWDAITRNSICTYHGHNGYVTAVTWSPDGARIASASVDRTVQVWRPR